MFTDEEVDELIARLRSGKELPCPRCGHALKTMDFLLDGLEEIQWFGCPGCARHGAGAPGG